VGSLDGFVNRRLGRELMDPKNSDAILEHRLDSSQSPTNGMPIAGNRHWCLEVESRPTPENAPVKSQYSARGCCVVKRQRASYTEEEAHT